MKKTIKKVVKPVVEEVKEIVKEVEPVTHEEVIINKRNPRAGITG